LGKAFNQQIRCPDGADAKNVHQKIKWDFPLIEMPTFEKKSGAYSPHIEGFKKMFT
jgi:hypothetical protein